MSDEKEDTPHTNLRNLRNYTVKLADVGCTKPKVDNINSMFLSNNDIFKG